MTKPIVAKFGGSSLAYSDKFRRAAAIVAADPRRRFIVVSAPGKRYASDTKITDDLHGWCEGDSGTRRHFVERVYARFAELISDLKVPIDLRREFEAIADKELSLRSDEHQKALRAYIMSRGEYLSARIFAALCDYTFVDATFIKFGGGDVFSMVETKRAAMHVRLHEMERVVIPGFYGMSSTRSAGYRTFPRGGSDITGAIVSSVVGAGLYENWTDVDGIYTADPRVVDTAEKIDVMTYREMRELSYMGASVFHEDAVAPVCEAGIPIHVRNAATPDNEGTLICPRMSGPSPRPVTGIAGKNGFSTVTIEQYGLDDMRGILWRTAKIFDEEGVGVNPMPGIDSLTFIVRTSDLKPVESRIVGKLKRRHALVPRIDHGIALLCIVGEDMCDRIGVTATIDDALAGSGISIVLQAQSSTQINVIRGVRDSDLEKAIRAIHRAAIA